MMDQSRTGWADYAKAIGILLVVYGHVSRGLSNSGFPVSDGIYLLVDSIIYSFHMPLFFFLSGLFFYSSWQSKRNPDFVFSKVDTILYPYVIWSLAQGFVELGLSSQTNSEVNLGEVLALWEPRAQFWFLYVLFSAFLISAVIYTWMPEKMSIVLLALAAGVYVHAPDLTDVRVLGFLYENFVFFVFGIVFTQYKLDEHSAKRFSLPALLLLFVATQIAFHEYLEFSYLDKGLISMLLAMLSITFVVSISAALPQESLRWLAYIGTSSMAIYLMHIMAGSGTRIVLDKVLKVESVPVHLLVGCIAAVLLPLLALQVIQALKIPYLFSAPVSKWLGASSTAESN